MKIILNNMPPQTRQQQLAAIQAQVQAIQAQMPALTQAVQQVVAAKTIAPPSAPLSAPPIAPAAAAPITTPQIEEERRVMDDILNWVLTQKQWYGTERFPFDNREDMIEQGKLLWPKYEQFIIDTIYRELRAPPEIEPPYVPPSYEVYKGLPEAPSETGDPTLDTILDLLKKQAQPLSADLIADFLKRAETEIDPYYKTQLALAREELLRQVGYSREDILLKEEDLERKYGRAVRTLGEVMAERGMAISGPRILAERELAEATQRDIEAQRREIAFRAGTTARAYAREWGGLFGEAPPTYAIPEAPRVLPGEMAFERPTRELPFYEISPEVYEGLIGEKEWIRRGEKRERAAEFEKIYRTFGEAGLRQITV